MDDDFDRLIANRRIFLFVTMRAGKCCRRQREGCANSESSLFERIYRNHHVPLYYRFKFELKVPQTPIPRVTKGMYIVNTIYEAYSKKPIYISAYREASTIFVDNAGAL